MNLERPVRLGGLVGGHLVQGHVDGVGHGRRPSCATARRRASGSSGRIPRSARLLIPQGSVAVDGVSLTVAALDATGFEIMLIPHTLGQTTLGRAQTGGRRVNLEMDMIGKYVQRFLTLGGSTA